MLAHRFDYTDGLQFTEWFENHGNGGTVRHWLFAVGFLADAGGDTAWRRDGTEPSPHPSPGR